MNIIKSQKGAMSLGTLVFLLVVGTSAYVGLKMAYPLVKNFQVKEVFRNEVARLKKDGEERVRYDVNNRLAELGVKLLEQEYYEDGLLIYHLEEDNETSPWVMEGRYNMDVEFLGGYKYTYRFNPKRVAKQ